MGAGHSHGPAAGHAGGRHRWRLAVSFGLIAAFFVVELTYGLLSGSMALLSDAGYMAADVVALGAALVAAHLVDRDTTTAAGVLTEARRVLRTDHGIEHATLQVEASADRGCHELDW